VEARPLPLTIPPFNQYQSPIVPLRGLWNAAPVEGDKFVTAEIDWFVTTTQPAVQFAISGNSPVAFSQIAAMAVDNSRSGADVVFVFSDSGFELVVPAHESVVAPVFTNALMFYVIAQGSQIGDVTAFQVLNSTPPTITLSPAVNQNHASVAGITLANGSTPIVSAGTSGTLNTISVNVEVAQGASAGVMNIGLFDGAGNTVWEGLVNAAANSEVTVPNNVSGLSLRFSNGLNCIIQSSNLNGFATVNVYYSTP
jgi:hypothetical protein